MAIADKKLIIAMLGHKHMLSREGGIEIVVNELATRMAERGHQVVCYDRSGHHISGGEIEDVSEYRGVKIVSVWTVKRKGLAAMTSSLSAAWEASKSAADVVHIHAEGPAAMCWLPKMRGKRVIVTIHGLDWQR
ncbi:MAG: glycosyltransferase, partial [Aeriscardovia sp.]|nr:glycosyltransferase [Aeriscardovia sp.]